MERRIEKELLDELPPEDARAIRSRLDLDRLNAWMGHPRLLAHVLQHSFARHLSLRLVELGAGDGEFLLRVANRLRGRWRNVDALLVDRQPLVTPKITGRFAEAHWRVQSAATDVFAWLRETPVQAEAVTANLFLHHFTNAGLREIFSGAAARAQLFVALEPRRAPRTLFLSRLIWLLGCNPVTRHDAVVSARAGFAGRELSDLWPDTDNWELTERAVGWCSHLFIARRRQRTDAGTLFEPIVSAVFQRPGDASATNGNAPTEIAPRKTTPERDVE